MLGQTVSAVAGSRHRLAAPRAQTRIRPSARAPHCGVRNVLFLKNLSCYLQIILDAVNDVKVADAKREFKTVDKPLASASSRANAAVRCEVLLATCRAWQYRSGGRDIVDDHQMLLRLQDR
ncbi:hypothetical protein EVAR_88291_1 [Eumeta japonica]|uniref:Uncharacterized protein n=1 Tax=Eumeta variegata TaxID=151549 RepID=A0A4C1VMD4_EUMVA|nr:hypothetical protein EVAR_88291_1 [Eumeta japonica]